MKSQFTFTCRRLRNCVGCSSFVADFVAYGSSGNIAAKLVIGRVGEIF